MLASDNSDGGAQILWLRHRWFSSCRVSRQLDGNCLGTDSAFYNAVPGTAILEQIALGWLFDVLQLPPESGGGFVTGTTVMNVTA